MAAKGNESVAVRGSWVALVTHASAGAAVGGLLAGLYGGLVAVVHFASIGRWDRGPEFAASSLAVGAALGLVLGKK